LHDLFAAPDDPRIEETLTTSRRKAKFFAERFRPLMAQPEHLKPEQVLAALQESEAIYESLSRVGTYGSLLYASDTANRSWPKT
jgi:oligoendopeptidase F